MVKTAIKFLNAGPGDGMMAVSGVLTSIGDDEPSTHGD